MVSILDDARLFFSTQTDFAALQDNFDFLNPTVIDIGHTVIAKVKKRNPMMLDAMMQILT